MIKRNYFFSCKILSSDKDFGGYRTIYYHATRKSWLDDSKGALLYCIEKAKKDASEHGYNGVLIIQAFNRI